MIHMEKVSESLATSFTTGRNPEGVDSDGQACHPRWLIKLADSSEDGQE